jgi:hypothetical protein
MIAGMHRMPRSFASLPLPALVAAAGLVCSVGCVEEGPEGTTGANGKVVFQATTSLVFSSPVSVGSSFDVGFVKKNDDVELSDSATLTVTGGEPAGAASIVEKEGDAGTYTVTLEGAGFVKLVVEDGGEDVDFISVDTRVIANSALVDDALLNASQVVDARLPQRFAILNDQTARVLVSAVDACAAGVLDLGTSALVVVPVEEGVDPATVATVTADGEAAFIVEPVAESGAFSLELRTADLAVLSYDIDIISRGDVDEVQAEVAQVDTQSNVAQLWGRAFVDDIDVVGIAFDWSSDARVALSSVNGGATSATISFPTDGTVDDRPATVTAEAFGVAGSVDLLALTAEKLVGSRGGVPDRPAADTDDDSDDAAAGDGCTGGGAGTCTAAGLLSAGLLRRRRRA